MFKSGVFSNKIWTKIFFLFYLLSLIMCESVGKKIIARTLCTMHHGILSLYYIFNNDAYFLDFRAQKFLLIFLFKILFNIKKAPVKFRDDGLYFQHFMLFFVFVPNQ